MLSHAMVGTNDRAAAGAFYDKVLATLGYTRAGDGDRGTFYSDGLNNFIVGTPANGEPAFPANGATIGFTASSIEAVDAFASSVEDAGGRMIEDPPGIRINPFGQFYIAYARDLDGNKICALYGPLTEEEKE
ncbi:MAG: VOC family protein [Pontixanthobacter sp.]